MLRIISKNTILYKEISYPEVPDDGCPWIGKQTLSDRKCKELNIDVRNHSLSL